MIRCSLGKYRASLAVIIGLLFAACGGDTPSNTSGSVPAGSPTPTVNAASAATPTTPAAGDASKLEYASAAGYEGFHDITNCVAILGWVRNSKKPNTPVKVDIYDNNTLLTTVTADQLRSDLVSAAKGHGKYGFFYPTPNSLKDGRPHTIRMTISGTQLHLTNTLKVLTCTP
jgi:hypothetical protein